MDYNSKMNTDLLNNKSREGCRALLTYSSYYDATTASKRVLDASKSLFSEIKILYWARIGNTQESDDAIYEGIEKVAYTKVAPSRSFRVLLQFIKFQFWVFKNIRSYKPDFIHAFYLYTIIPCLLYKYIFNRKCVVLYDPRDYVAVCYNVPKIVSWLIMWIDSICIKLADYVIFPDKQYFTYYGKLKLKESKYLIIPNSLEDSYEKVVTEDVYSKYNISKEKLIIPLLGYFSETRGKTLFYEIIKLKPEGFHFIIAGYFRDKEDIDFFRCQSNVTYLGTVSYWDALAIMKDSAIVPLLYDPVLLNNKHAYPTKFYDSLMVGVPVLVSYGQVDVYEDIMKYNLGLGIKYNDLEGFQEVLELLKTRPYHEERFRLRKLYLEKYDFDIFRDKLRQTYIKLIGPAKSMDKRNSIN